MLLQQALSLKEICRLEPRVATLLEQSPAARSDWREYERIKRQLRRFVGWDAERPELQTSDVYQTVLGELARRIER